MTEASQVWAVARRYLAPYGFFARIEDRLALGVPDVHYVLRGVTGWWESKLFDAEGRAPSHLTREQVMWGEAYAAAGGRWHLMGRAWSTWLLYDVAGARALFEGREAAPLVRAAGRFPLREMLDTLAPLR